MGSSHSVHLQSLVVSRFSLDGGAMCGIIPRPIWSKRFSPDDRGRISLVSRCLIARFPEQQRTVVIDAGLGRCWSDDDIERYNIDQHTPSLSQSLRKLAIEPSSVTDALITHLHFDHAGGFVDCDSEGKRSPVFSSAAHHLQREHWKWASAPSPKDQGSFIKENWNALEQANLLHFLDGETELIPGFELLVCRGHTVGMQLPLIRGKARCLLFLSDLVPTAAHLRSPWIMAYDLHPLDTLREKEELLTLAAARRWILYFTHDPELEAATIHREGSRWIVEPCACPSSL